jgi:hypothetical protein
MMDLPAKHSFDEILLQLTRVGLPAQPLSPRKVLFWGERTGEIASYAAGWLAGKGIDVIVLDGVNRFDPYMISSFARKALIPPEKLLKKIRIARAFTCYQMATLVGEKLACLLNQEGGDVEMEKRWVILLGPMTTFLDEDVPEREVRPLFERSLRKLEEMALKGIPFFLFQPSGFSGNTPFSEGGVGRLRESKRVYLIKRLFEFSNLVWKLSLEDQEPKAILERESGLNIIENFCNLQFKF